MPVISMKALLESGVHFGHRTHKWHPAMKPYIFTERNGIHIIDLQKTAKAIEQAYNIVRDTVAEGGTVLFVGTKRQAQDTIREEAERCGMPYVTNRWLGGMLTNWRTIRQRVLELERLERMRSRGEFAALTKKEGLLLERKMERLDALLGGIRKLPTLPDLLFIVDVYRESTAIHEANLLNIPVIALVDTNCDPTNVDYVVPSNDDAIRAIKLLVSKIADAAVEGKALHKEEEVEALPAEMAMAIAEEPELSDEELLGEATLAKLPSRSRAIFEELEEVEIAEEELEVFEDEELEEFEELEWEEGEGEEEDLEEEAEEEELKDVFEEIEEESEPEAKDESESGFESEDELDDEDEE